MPGPLVVPVALGIAQILGSLFGNIFGATKQAGAVRDSTRLQTQAQQRAAEIERDALDKALEYQKSLDTRDYADYMRSRDREWAQQDLERRDFEANEQRRAPFRALADSSIRTLADYIRVPGMHAPQEVPVQRWSQPSPAGQTYGGAPTSSTMPVGGNLRAYAEQPATTQAPAQMAQPQQPQALLAKFGRQPRNLRDLAMFS